MAKLLSSLSSLALAYNLRRCLWIILWIRLFIVIVCYVLQEIDFSRFLGKLACCQSRNLEKQLALKIQTFQIRKAACRYKLPRSHIPTRPSDRVPGVHMEVFELKKTSSVRPFVGIVNIVHDLSPSCLMFEVRCSSVASQRGGVFWSCGTRMTRLTTIKNCWHSSGLACQSCSDNSSKSCEQMGAMSQYVFW